MLTNEECIELSRKALMERDQYQMARLVAPLKACGGPAVLVDIGANVGWWTLKFLEAWPEAESRCFEPIQENWRRIPEDPRISVYPLAVDVKEGALQLYRHTGSEHVCMENGQLWSALEVFKGPVTMQRTVPAESFSHILVSGPIGVLKIDIEGHDKALIESIGPDDLKNVWIVSLEDHGWADRQIFADAGMFLWYEAEGQETQPIFAANELRPWIDNHDRMGT